MADELIIRVALDASGVTAGADQGSSALNQFGGQLDHITVAGTKVSVAQRDTAMAFGFTAEAAVDLNVQMKALGVAQQALTQAAAANAQAEVEAAGSYRYVSESAAEADARIRGLTAAQREQMTVRPGGVPFGTLESTGNRVEETYSETARAMSGVGAAFQGSFATPSALSAIQRSLQDLPVSAAEAAAGVSRAFASAPVTRNVITAITKDLEEVQNAASIAGSGVATAFTAATVPQATLKAVTEDLSTAIAAEGASVGTVGVALGDAATVSAATLSSVGKDLTGIQSTTERAAHGVSTAMEAAFATPATLRTLGAQIDQQRAVTERASTGIRTALEGAFVAPASLRTLGAQVAAQQSVVERAAHGITTAVETAFVTPPTLKRLGSDIVTTLVQSGQAAETSLAGKVVTAAEAAGVALGSQSTRVKALAGTLEEGAEAAGHISFATAGATREFIVLGHEAISGNFSRIPGSMIVLAERVGGLHTVVSALTGGWIAVGVAGVAALVGIGFAAYQAVEGVLALRDATDRLIQGGVGSSQAAVQAKQLTQTLSAEYHESGSTIKAIVDELRKLPSEALSSQVAIAKIGEAFAGFEHLDSAKGVKAVVEAFKTPEGALKWAEATLDLNGALTESGDLVKNVVKTYQDSNQVEKAWDTVTHAILRGSAAQGEALQKARTDYNAYLSIVGSAPDAAAALAFTGQLPSPPKRIGEYSQPADQLPSQVRAGVETANELAKEEQKRRTLSEDLNTLKEGQLGLEGQIEGALMAGNNAAAQQLQIQLAIIKAGAQRLDLEASKVHGPVEAEEHGATMARQQGEIAAQRNNPQAVIAIRRRMADEVLRYETEAIAKVRALQIANSERITPEEALPRAREEAQPIAEQLPAYLQKQNEVTTAVLSLHDQEFKTWIDQMREAEAQAGRSGAQRIAIEEQVNAAVHAAAQESEPRVNMAAVEASDKHLAEVKRQESERALEAVIRNHDEELRAAQHNAGARIAIEQRKADAIRSFITTPLIAQGRTPEAANAVAAEDPRLIDAINRGKDATRAAEREKLDISIATERARVDETERGSQARLQVEKDYLAKLQEIQAREGVASIVGEREIAEQKIRLANTEREVRDQAFRDYAADSKKRVAEEKGNADAIIAIFRDLAEKAATVFQQRPSIVIGIETEGVKAGQQADKDRFQNAESNVRLYEAISRQEIAIDKAKHDIAVAQHRESKSQALAAEQQYTEQVLAQIIERVKAEELANAKLPDDRIKALQDLARAEGEYTAKVIEDQAKITQAVEAENKKQVETIKQGFDQIGSSVETAFKGIISGSISSTDKVVQQQHVAANGVVFFTNTVQHQSALAAAGMKVLDGTATAIVDTFLKLGTQAAAKSIAPVFGQQFSEGEVPSLSGLFAKVVGGLFGLGNKTPKTDSLDKLIPIQTEQQKTLAEIRDLLAQKGVVGAGTGATAPSSNVTTTTNYATAPSGFSSGLAATPGSVATPEISSALAQSGLPPEARALLGAISGGEATSFREGYGGKMWTGSLSEFPPSSFTSSLGGKTHPFGAFQFEPGTYKGISAQTGLTDVEPQSQITNAWALAQQDYKSRTGGDLLSALQGGNLAQVQTALRPTWPGGANFGFTSRYQANLAASSGGTTSVPMDVATTAVPSAPTSSGAPTLPVDIEQVAGSDLPLTTGGGLPVSKTEGGVTTAPSPVTRLGKELYTGESGAQIARTQEAEYQRAQANVEPQALAGGTTGFAQVPTAATVEQNTAAVTQLSTSAQSLSTAVTNQQASVQADVSNTHTNTMTVQSQTSAAQVDADATKASSAALADNTAALKALTEKLGQGQPGAITATPSAGGGLAAVAPLYTPLSRPAIATDGESAAKEATGGVLSAGGAVGSLIGGPIGQVTSGITKLVGAFNTVTSGISRTSDGLSKIATGASSASSSVSTLSTAASTAGSAQTTLAAVTQAEQTIKTAETTATQISTTATIADQAAIQTMATDALAAGADFRLAGAQAAAGATAGGASGGGLGSIPIIGPLIKGVSSLFGGGGGAAAGLGAADAAASGAADAAAGGFAADAADLALLALSGGGMIPSVAGGMTVNDGKGGTLAIVHPQEMVLPASISAGIQHMISSVPSAAGGMVVSGGPQSVAPLGWSVSGTVGSPSTPGFVSPATPPHITFPNVISPSSGGSRTTTLLALGGAGLLAGIPLISKLFDSNDENDGWSSSADTDWSSSDNTDWSSSDWAGGSDFSSFSLMRGGVIPSAAGGMRVDDGKGGTLAIVHPNEMVLPADLSRGIQNIVSKGGLRGPGIPSADEGMVVPGDALGAAPTGNAGSASNAFQQGTATLQTSAGTLGTAGTSLITSSQQLSAVAKSGGSGGSGGGALGLVGKLAGTIVGGLVGGPVGAAVGGTLGGAIGSFDLGTDRVPYTGLALIHKDEMIIPAERAGQIRAGGGSSGGPVFDVPGGADKRPSDFMLPNYADALRGAVRDGMRAQEGAPQVDTTYHNLRSAVRDGMRLHVNDQGGASSGNINTSLSYAPTVSSSSSLTIQEMMAGESQGMTDWVSAMARGEAVPLPGGSSVGRFLGHFAKGTDRVRETGLAVIHANEMIVPAAHAERLRSMMGVGGIDGLVGSFAVGAREVKETGIAEIHRGEMIVPAAAANEVRLGAHRQPTSDFAKFLGVAPTTAIATTVPPGARPTYRDAFTDPRGFGLGSGMMIGQPSTTVSPSHAQLHDFLEARLPHFELGAWEISRDQAGFLHKGESVMPSGSADLLRDLLTGGGTTSNGGDVNLHYSPTVNAPAAPNLESLLTREGQTMLGWINAQMRSGALRPPPS